MMTRRFFGLLAAVAAAFLPSRATSQTTSAPRRLQDDIPVAAQWISSALQSSGYRVDFTPRSISEVERFFREQTKDGEPISGGLISQDVGPRLFALGCYCGEVLRKELGGHWLTDDNDPEGEINAALEVASGVTCWPMQRVMKRLRSSEEDLVAWAEGIRRG
ncbi:hypothetical protein NKH89_25875 [Mesorhizobium sp. M0923]|uniref:hypothetical protein n=1 Tax=unclassified Mesorhizobium TaxID=325217 RepID=UPI0003CF95E5|nr:hypothetical protein [Mesorhizobium sp. LSHC420B00]ESX78833.1 hypothetical protein X759_14605 [Mesorhizobium sp. LSHC420B00]